MTATLCRPSCCTIHGIALPIELHVLPKQMGAMFGKKFGGPAHSALMFQPKVGMPALASSLAPLNSSTASNTAYTLSSASIACVSLRLLTVLSSRSLVSFSCRPHTPPFEFTTSK